jgi:hypothetical protein
VVEHVGAHRDLAVEAPQAGQQLREALHARDGEHAAVEPGLEQLCGGARRPDADLRPVLDVDLRPTFRRRTKTQGAVPAVPQPQQDGFDVLAGPQQVRAEVGAVAGVDALGQAAEDDRVRVAGVRGDPILRARAFLLTDRELLQPGALTARRDELFSHRSGPSKAAPLAAVPGEAGCAPEPARERVVYQRSERLASVREPSSGWTFSTRASEPLGYIEQPDLDQRDDRDVTETAARSIATKSIGLRSGRFLPIDLGEEIALSCRRERLEAFGSSGFP